MRVHFSELRSRLTSATLQSYNQSICLKVKNLPIWDRKVYHCFLSRSQGDEVNTACIVELIDTSDRVICVPRIESKGVMSARIFQSDTRLKLNRYGIPEPSDKATIMEEARIDVVFVPLLAFDRQGNRLGYGGGFYDRLWESCTPDSIWVGLSLLEASESLLPSEPHDLRLDYALTPTRTHRF